MSAIMDQLLDSMRTNEMPDDAFFDGADVPASSPRPTTSDDDERGKPTQAERALAVVRERATLFHTDMDECFASVPVGQSREAMRLRSPKFKSWIVHTVRSVDGKGIGSAGLDEALLALEGEARCEGECLPVHIRVAAHDDALWLDLAATDGRFVRVDAHGWTVETSAPVHFVRPSAMRPLPAPVHGGDVSELRSFLNVAEHDGYVLALAWLVAAYRPGKPFPVLCLVGEQGTGKSIASRVLRSLVDPSAAPLRSVPREESDLFIGAMNAHVVAYDNLSGVVPWLSDGLCKLATGGAFAKRALYTDYDESVLQAIRPIIANGIDNIATRSDLADRSLLVSLKPIPEDARRDEAQLWSAFDVTAPRILGALLGGVSSALANVGTVSLASLPRMADFAKWATAAEPGLGLADGAVMDAYHRQMARAVDVALEASPVASAVRDLLSQSQRHGTWEGTARALLGDLNIVVGDDAKRAAGWPKQANVLSRELNRNRTFLRKVGIDLETGSTGRDAGKRKFLKLTTRQGEGQ
jgi:hypothetical protein